MPHIGNLIKTLETNFGLAGVCSERMLCTQQATPQRLTVAPDTNME